MKLKNKKLVLSIIIAAVTIIVVIACILTGIKDYQKSKDAIGSVTAGVSFNISEEGAESHPVTENDLKGLYSLGDSKQTKITSIMDSYSMDNEQATELYSNPEKFTVITLKAKVSNNSIADIESVSVKKNQSDIAWLTGSMDENYLTVSNGEEKTTEVQLVMKKSSITVKQAIKLAESEQIKISFGFYANGKYTTQSVLAKG